MNITPFVVKLFMVFTAVALLSACTPRPIATAATPEDIRQQIMQSDAPLTLVHAWATWCTPCRDEFPELLKVYHDFHPTGLHLILVSADDPDQLEKVENFLFEQQSPVGSLISTELNEDFINTLSPNWSGVLPSSFFFDANGALLFEWEGPRSYEQYSATIKTLLNQTTGDAP